MSLTQRFLRATPMRLDTTATLDEIEAQMTLPISAPQAQIQKTGWGSFLDGDNILNLPNFTPTVHPPVRFTAVREEPETLAARYYYFKRNPTLRKLEPANADPSSYHVLKAIDVLISPIPDAENSFTVLVASWDRDETTYASNALKSLVGLLDQDVILHADTSILDFIDDDFFLWLVARSLQNVEITEDMSLDGIRRMDTKDALHHTVNMGAGIDATRGELLYLVAQDQVSFGPGRLNVAHDRLGINLDFELKVNGGFSITMKTTEFTAIDEEDEHLAELERRLRAFQQAAHVVIPELKETWQRDSVWRTSGRAEFREDCRAETNRRTNA